jgi:dephospho-CoA kinase
VSEPSTPIAVFGLTGGLASGKSSVATHLRAKGLPVIDADALAREVVAPGSAAFEEIVQGFGPDVVRRGALDRRRLAALVFSDAQALRRLESIVHPRVQQRKATILNELAAAGEPLAAYEVPLLYEKQLETELHPVVVVALPEALQLERARSRDGSSEAEVRARLAAQLPLASKAARADYVIDNAGTLAQTFAAADRTLLLICERLGIDPARYDLTRS